MHTVVIGGTGHIGTYLVPRLVRRGHDVTNVARGERDPYQPDGAWDAVDHVTLDREAHAPEAFAGEIAALNPDVVVDLINFEPEGAAAMVEALDVRQFLHCGTIWVHGRGVEQPTTESQPRDPLGEYGRKKAEIEELLHDAAAREGFPAAVLHPGHIVGPGWVPLTPRADADPAVFDRLARGEAVRLPNLGMETLHHVHADDVAQAFERALDNRATALGESYHVVSPAAVTTRGYAEAVADFFGAEPDLTFLPWEEYREAVGEDSAEVTWDHVARSPNCSIEKARRHLDYEPRYSSLEAIRESLRWLADRGEIDAPDWNPPESGERPF